MFKEKKKPNDTKTPKVIIYLKWIFSYGAYKYVHQLQLIIFDDFS